jgi:hypothetical protein
MAQPLHSANDCNLTYRSRWLYRVGQSEGVRAIQAAIAVGSRLGP